VGELSDGLNVSHSSAKTVKHSWNVTTLLHRDDSELILFVDPDNESLVFVVEDASARGPVAIQTTSLKESVSFFEEEVIIDELLLSFLVHALERVEGALEVAFEGVASFSDEAHDFFALLFGDARAKREGVKVATDANSRRPEHLAFFFGEGGRVQAVGVHLRHVHVIWSMTVVVLYDLVEEFVEGSVGVS